MNKKTVSSIFWGVLIIALGVILGGNVMGIWDFDVFFPGWWTMFIILPCLYWIFTKGPDFGNVAGLILGVLLLLDNTEFFGKYISWKLIFPVIIVIIGINIIASAVRNANEAKNGVCAGKTTFSEQKFNYDGKPFDGGIFKCSFGDMKIDLSNAVINQTNPFRVFCSFGSVKIFVPSGVSVDIKSNISFGEVKNECVQTESGIPLNIEAECSFGEVKIIQK